jgi:serine/threonine-protein kinase HipA
MTETLVYVDLPEGRTVHAGWIHYETNAGQYKPSINFEYAATFLGDPDAYELSPDLPLRSGFLAAPLSRDVFMAFADAQPDAWGRKLLQPEFRRRARTEGRQWTPPTEMDMLLQVPDRTRQGALRFRSAADGPFLGESSATLPTLVDLDTLVAAAAGIENGTFDANDEGVRMLVQVGTTQGGARPKATVLDERGRLAIAKLPHPDDRWDVQGWEAVALELAGRSGIRVPHFTVHPLSEWRSVLVTERFDRDGDRRIGYLSARSILLADPGAPVDYTSLAGHVGETSSRAAVDREELFRRVALTLLINNVDDHMKNHGVIRESSGWRLSPVFDLNPFPRRGQVDSTPVTPEDDPYDRDIRLLVASADQYRLTAGRAVEIIREVAAETAKWPTIAGKYVGDKESFDTFAEAFDGKNRMRAAELTAAAPPLVIDVADVADDDGHGAEISTGKFWVRAHIRNGRQVEGYWRER